MDTSIEHLNYALSYDPEHVGANYLMGRVYMEQFEDYDKAEEYFQEALSFDPKNYKVCEKYAHMLVNLREFSQAEKIIKHMESLRGKDMASIYHTKAIISEYQRNFVESERFMKIAMEETYNDNYMEYLESELERIQSKHRRTQKYVYETD